MKYLITLLVCMFGSIKAMDDQANWYAAQVKQLANAFLINSLAVTKNIPQAQKLIAAGADVNAVDSDGKTVLLWVVERGFIDSDFIESLHVLITAGADLNMHSSEGNTALCRVAFKGSADMAAALIKGGAALDIQDSIGNTPLMYAVFRSNTSFVQMLMDAGARLDIQNNYQYTALGIAVREQRTEMVTLLATHDNVFKIVTLSTPQDMAAWEHMRSEMHVLKKLSNEHMLVNWVNQDGNTPLHCAVLAGNRSMVVLLLSLMFQAKCGESIVRRNGAGFTPLDIAVLKAPTSILPLLFKFVPCAEKLVNNELYKKETL